MPNYGINPSNIIVCTRLKNPLQDFINIITRVGTTRLHGIPPYLSVCLSEKCSPREDKLDVFWNIFFCLKNADNIKTPVAAQQVGISTSHFNLPIMIDFST